MMTNFLEDYLSEDLEVLPTVTLPPASLTCLKELTRQPEHITWPHFINKVLMSEEMNVLL